MADSTATRHRLCVCCCRYRDPLTGHYYADAEAFRELRRRLGQPLPPPQPYRRLAASPAAELQGLLDAAATRATAAAAAAAATDPAAADGTAAATAEAGSSAAATAAAGAGASVPAAAAAGVAGGDLGVSGLPAGQQQLQQLVEQHMLQQLAVASSKGRAKSQAYYQTQQPVPDEVAALVLQVSQIVHG